MRRARSFAAPVLVSCALLALAPPASACSICRCDDPANTVAGDPSFGPRTWRFAFETAYFSKDQIAEDAVTSADREAEKEMRYTATGSWRATSMFTLVGRLPFSQRTLETGMESASQFGFSDPELLLDACVLKAPGAAIPTWVTLTAGVRAPWGMNDAQLGGERAEEHLQPGTGAVGLTGGVSVYTRVATKDHVYGSLAGRWNGENTHDYRYGNVMVASLAYQRELTPWLEAVAETDYRDARQDVSAGEADPNTGGSVLYAVPRVQLQLTGHLALRVGVQIPVATNLDGDQREFTNFQSQIVLKP